jgi:3-hydroxyacyl-CoA dehydrogenase
MYAGGADQHAHHRPEVLDQLEAFVTSGLGKGVVRAKDTPNFIANRVGIAGMLATMKEVENFGLTYDVVDDLTGKKLGRASSGTFRTADVVGLDTMAHVIKTLQDNLTIETDPFYASFGTPAVLAKLMELGNLGQKTKAGFYKKVGRDPALRARQRGLRAGRPEGRRGRMAACSRSRPAERLKLLRNSEGPQGQFLWAILRNSFHYAAVHLGTIADTARDVDQAMRWGFGMKQGPFELWQEAGWLEVAEDGAGRHRRGQGAVQRAAARVGVQGPGGRGRWRAHGARARGARPRAKFVARRALPVYERQPFPEALRGETLPDFRTAGTQAMLPGFMMGGAAAIDEAVAELQRVMRRLRYASVPVVSAVRGLALGGGCEMAVHSARRVAHMESYVGLVEVGVGLVPGAGGLTYIARRAAENAATSTGKDLLPFLTEGFTAAAMAKVGTSALESRKLGYLLESDVIVPHKDELLFVALNEAKALYQGGYRAPHKRLFAVAGRSGKATILGSLVNMRDGGFISQHDFHIASLIANVVTGGDVDSGTLVSEEYLMTLERRAFCSLLEHPKTQERIMGMLSTGKPVRN